MKFETTNAITVERPSVLTVPSTARTADAPPSAFATPEVASDAARGR